MDENKPRLQYKKLRIKVSKYEKWDKLFIRKVTGKPGQVQNQEANNNNGMNYYRQKLEYKNKHNFQKYRKFVRCSQLKKLTVTRMEYIKVLIVLEEKTIKNHSKINNIAKRTSRKYISCSTSEQNRNVNWVLKGEGKDQNETFFPLPFLEWGSLQGRPSKPSNNPYYEQWQLDLLAHKKIWRWTVGSQAGDREQERKQKV